MYGEYLTVQELEDGLSLDQRVPSADAGSQIPAFAAFPFQPAAPGCWTSRYRAFPPTASSAVAKTTTPPTTGYTP